MKGQPRIRVEHDGGKLRVEVDASECESDPMKRAVVESDVLAKVMRLLMAFRDGQVEKAAPR